MTDTNYLKGTGNKKEAVKFLLKTIKPEWLKLTIVIIVTLVAAVFELLSIGLIFPLLNSLNPTDNDSQLNMPIDFLNTFFSGFTDNNKIRFIAVSLLILQSCKYLLTALIQIIIAKIQINVDKNLRLMVINDLLYSEIKFINKTPVAENFTILNTFTGHTGRLALSVTSVINPIIMVFVYMFALITISWQLTLISTLFVAISTYAMSYITKKTSEVSGKRNRAAVKLNQLGFETISAIKHIQLFTKEKHAFNQYQEGTNNVNNLVYKASKLRAYSSPLFQISNLSSVVILLVLATIIFSNQQEFILGIILTYLFVMLRLIGPLQTLNTQRIAIAGQIPSMTALKYFFDRKDKKRYIFGNEAPLKIDKIDIRDVCFQYEENATPILKDINLEIEKGTITAIVGPSGSGKSTLVNLLLRLYEPTKGKITADKKDIRNINIYHWRANVGMVSQNTFIFNDTIENNIRFAKPSANMSEIIDAAKKANAHEFINNMKESYQTIVGDQGVRLSGGESQRISIARTILYNPQILILDEATSSLDAESEKLVQDAIDNLSIDRTVIAIAHRLSTIKGSDKIIVIDSGAIAEVGTHDELMTHKGLYHKYINLQSIKTK